MKIKRFILFVFLIKINFYAWAASEYFEKGSDVINVSEAQLTSDYWIDLNQKQLNGQSTLIDYDKINEFNQQVMSSSVHVIEPLFMKEMLNKVELITLINKISSVPKGARFYDDGHKLGEKEFSGYRDNVNISGVFANNKVKWGLVVKRSPLRTFPTKDRVYNKGMDKDLDRFQETAVFPGEAVAVLHESKDKQWYLVRAYNYLAWVSQKDIAVGSKETINNFIQSKHFLVVTGSKVFTTFVPNKPEISQVQLDMGVKLPLINNEEHVGNLYGQNPYTSHIVQFPVRNKQGELVFLPAMIAKSEDTNIGYLAFTKQNIINQAFKFLGERYGWGHDYNARDCTGFVGEIYKSFGLLMPRNSGQQGRATYGKNVHFTSKSSKQDKLAAISQLEVGDLLYIPGHVVMYIGTYNNQPYIIHDVKGLSYYLENKQFYKGTLNGVSVTPLLPLQLSKTKSYIDTLYSIKKIRLN